jgi:Matrixin/EF hand
MPRPLPLFARPRRLATALLSLLFSTPLTGLAQQLELPLVAYRYTFAAAPHLDSQLSRSEIEALVAEVNRIWKPYDIRWKLQSVIDRRVEARDFAALTGGEERMEIKNRLLAIAPRSADRQLWKMVLIKEFPVPAGGLYLPQPQTLFFAEMSRGGKTSPIILAHELGHSLGLAHDRSPTNLMNPAAGARDSALAMAQALTPEQVTTSRAQAQEGPITRADMTHDMDSSGPNSRAQAGSPGRGAPDGAQRKRMADRFRTFDRDGDGVILMADVPEPGQRTFQRIDKNADGRLDALELDEFSR